jgi:hypothetical protein
MVERDWSGAQWFKSKRSGDNGDCVEFAVLADAVGVRHSTQPNSAILEFSHDAWRAFIDEAKAGGFDRAPETTG